MAVTNLAAALGPHGLAAFLIFFRTVSGHRPQDSGKNKLEEWIFAVIAGASGFLLSLLINLGASLYLAFRGASPELPHAFDQYFLVLQTWGFLVPFVWGSAARRFLRSQTMGFAITRTCDANHFTRQSIA